MSLSLHTNFAQMLTQDNVSKSNNMMSQAMQRLSTGLRINSASDDAAGLQIANRMESQSRGLNVAQRNAQDGVSLLQTAEGSLNELNDVALRMKDLATQGANGTNSQSERDALNTEYQDLADEYKSIVENTKFNGSEIFTNDTDSGLLQNSLTLQVGAQGGDAASADTLSVDVSSDVATITDFYATDATDIASISIGAAALFYDDGGDAGATSTDGSIAATAVATIEWDPTAGTSGEAVIVVGGSTNITESELYAAADKTGSLASQYLTQTTANGTTSNIALSDLSASDFTANGTAFATNSNTGDLTNQANATAAIETTDQLIDSISSFQSTLGSKVNRLGHTMSNLANQETNVDTARGRIMDADFATESANLTKYQMLMQAGTTMLSKTGQTSQMAMSLLR